VLNYTEKDCWVLFSIGFGNRGSRLNDIISTGDILNHAIFTKEELENGLNKLLNNGYIKFSNDRFYATDKAISFYNDNRKIAEGCIAEWLRMAEILKKQPIKSDEPSMVTITDEEYKNAVNKRRWF
jgi:hypothetical protein